MWPWIKRWHDWAMHDLWSLTRSGLTPQALHFSFEKAGLTLHDQPIPWNAEAIVVEALVKSGEGPRRKADYTLRLPGREAVPADAMRTRTSDDKTRLHFRLSPPSCSTAAELFWKERRLGALTLPILSQEEFIQNLCVQRPTFFVLLRGQSVPCQTFVSSQCRGLMATALLTSPTSLVPLLDLGLHVQLQSERGPIQTVSAQLCSSQLADRQAMIAVVPRKFPKRIGTWIATWMIGDRPLASQRIRAITQRGFQRSLRISDTRFIVENARGELKITRQAPPLDDVTRLGPCFLVSSKEPGMAGLCTLQIRAHGNNGSHSQQVREQDVLVTDGPAVVAPGTFGVRDLTDVSGFELKHKSESLGVLPLTPTPSASFTAEGGFKPATDFAWSMSADEELNDRLARLTDGKGG
jgi:hypothetical protein